MKKWNRLLSGALGLALALTLVPPARAAGRFTDVPDSHWAAAIIEEMAEKGVVSGTGGGQYSPSAPVTTAQFATMLCAQFYPDLKTPQGSQWYAKYYETAQAAGALNNVSAGPEDALTRYDMAQMMYNVMVGEKLIPGAQGETSGIADWASVPERYQDAVRTCYALKALSGVDSAGSFGGERGMDRAQAAAVMRQLLRVRDGGEPDPDPCPEPQPAPEPGLPSDLTVRTSGVRLDINGIPVYGLMEIGGELYIPAELFQGFSALAEGLEGSLEYGYRFSGMDLPARKTVPDYALAARDGIVVGTARPMDVKLGEDTVTAMTLDGRFLMFRPEDFHPDSMSLEYGVLSLGFAGRTTELSKEKDLVGHALTPLLRSDPRETVKAIHDYIVNTLTYADGEDQWEALDSVYEQYDYPCNVTLAAATGVCQDYTELFQAMCQRAGIPCEMMTGDAGGPHAWNRVYLDGTWYYVDCTWDDPVGGKPVLRHDYFLVGVDRMVVSHFWDGDDYPYKEYDPAWEQLDPNNITSADMFRKCLAAQIVLKKPSFDLRVTKSGAYGGTGIAYLVGGWWSFSGGYDRARGVYHFDVEY